MSSREKNFNFNRIIISPVTRPVEDYKWRERWDLKKKLEKTFSKYGSATCSYVSLDYESSLHAYQDNYAILDFKKKHEASRALKAIEDGSINYNKLVLTGKPLEDNYCPIDGLVDECLLRIFEFLSTYERLKLGEVCKRWRIVSKPLWKKSQKIDLREKLRENKKEKYLINSGSHLKDIYCFDDHGLRTIKNSCKNLENVAIEYRKYTTINGIDRACIRYERQALLQFKNLKRLMLKVRDSRYTYFSFLHQLPSSMMEIHLINDIKLPKNRWSEMDEYSEELEKCGTKLIDLSKFTGLKALTLECYILDDKSSIGFENLKKLIYLSLDNSKLSPGFINKLKFFNNLKHLSLRRIEMNHEDAWLIAKRNKYLEYLAVPSMSGGNDNDMWLCVMELGHIKALSFVEISQKIRELGLSRTVEYLELSDVWISNRRIGALVEEAFPNLKVLKYYQFGYSEYLTGRIKDSVLRRNNKNLLRYCAGKICKHYYHGRPIPDWNSENFEFCEVLPEDDAKVLRCYGWGGWYIDEDNSSKSMAKVSSNQRNISSISKLPNVLLKKIIDYLPVDDKINASRVCKRWRNVLSTNSRELLRRFDVRELSVHNNREKCFTHFGKYFEDVYYFSGCGLSVLEKYCTNFESLALDYQFRICECTKNVSYKSCYNFKWLKPSLLIMKNLTRLMLKDVQVFTSDLFKHLPEKMVEIHIFNKSSAVLNSMKSKKTAEVNHGTFDVPLSKFTNLRALTLLETDLPRQMPCGYAIKVTGIEKLDKLAYLRISEDIFADDYEKILKISKLEYLSVQHCSISNINLMSLLDNNKDLQYLDVAEIAGEITDTLLKSILSLRNLKYLRLKENNSIIQYSDPPADLDSIDRLENLLFLDIENDVLLPREVTRSLIGSSPKLKVVNLPLNSTFFGEDILTIAENNMINRRNNSSMRIFFGLWGQKLMEISGLRPPHIIIGNVPPQEYYTLIEPDNWGGWCIDDESVKLSEIIGKLFRSINS